MKKTIILCVSLLMLCTSLFSQNDKVMLNFEESEHFNITDGTQPIDGQQVNNDLFSDVFNVTLSTGSLGSNTPPRYAIAGGNLFAFASPNGRNCFGQETTTGENYIFGDVTNCFFITDSGTDQDIFVDVDESMLQVNRVVLDLLDVDVNEVIVVDVFAVGQVDAIASRTISAGDPGTGNAVATNVSIIIDGEVIDYVHVRSTSAAFIGLDNIMFEFIDDCVSSDNCDVIANFEENKECKEYPMICRTSTSTSSAEIISYLWVLTDLGTEEVAGTYSSPNGNVRICLEGDECHFSNNIIVENNEIGYELCLFVEDERGCMDRHCELFRYRAPGSGENGSEISDRSSTQQELIKASPNPFSNQLNLSFEIEQPGNVDIRVYNSQMQTVGRIGQNEFYQAGKHNIKWSPTNDLSAGVYFVEFSFSQGERVVRKVMHVR